MAAAVSRSHQGRICLCQMKRESIKSDFGVLHFFLFCLFFLSQQASCDCLRLLLTLLLLLLLTPVSQREKASDGVSSSFPDQEALHPPPLTRSQQPIPTPTFCLSRGLRKHAAEDVYEVVQSQQVAVLPVALQPGGPVVQGLRRLQRDRLPEVDHPHSGLARGVVHEQQGAAHHL